MSDEATPVSVPAKVRQPNRGKASNARKLVGARLARFLQRLAKTGSVTLACKAAGIDYATYWWRRKEDETFREQLRQAEREHLDAIEQ